KTVSLRVTNQWGCARTQTRTQYLQVNPLPTVDFQADKTQICGADTIQFTASVQGTAPYTYLWTFGSLGTSTQANPRFGFPGTPGSHTIQLDVTDARGCVKTVVKNNYISRVQVSGNFIAPASACQGATVNFVGSS